jgi:hypothetical protein
MAGGWFATTPNLRRTPHNIPHRRLGWVSLLALTVVSVPGLIGCSDKSEITAASATNATVLIEPNQSVGKIHANMHIDDLLKELGQPQRRTANALEYPQFGLAVMPDSEGTVSVVMCGDVTGVNGPFAKAFKGRTKEGMGMFSTREDIIKAYGEPTKAEKFPGGIEALSYAPLGIRFTLEGGKVHHMIVRLQGAAPPPDRTVTLEPPK